MFLDTPSIFDIIWKKEVTKMKHLRIVLLFVLAVGLIVPPAFAAGNVEKGKAMFNDPKAFGAPGPTSCSTCHPNGKGLEKAGGKGRKDWKNPAGVFLSLEDTINVCIVMANKGKAVDPKGTEMMDIVAYIKSLAKKK